MSFFDAIILGLVEGITEFLPISSTAHLMMTSKVLELNQSEFLKSFEVVIQLGAIVAVVFLFGSRLIKNAWLWKKVLIAFIPTAVIGFLLYKLIKTHLIGNISVAVWALVIGGVALIAVEHLLSKKSNVQGESSSEVKDITNKQAFFIGLTQSLAIIPGVSRAAATIVPALFFGASRKAAAEFSFLLAIPTVAAAAGYDLLKNFDTIALNDNIIILMTGFIVSMVAAVFSIKFMLSYISKHSFRGFGIYRIIVAGLFFLLFLG